MTGGRECIFCRIVSGTSPCQEIYRDDATLAFMDVHPANDGHCLVIPKRYFENVFGMPPEAFGEVGSTVAKVARAVNEVLQPGGISLVQANGELAGQTVFHVHVLPRRRQSANQLGPEPTRQWAVRQSPNCPNCRAPAFSAAGLMDLPIGRHRKIT
jgi:histidine triad (HIT) family protein